MATGAADPDLTAIERLTTAFVAELTGRDLADPIPWPTMPTVEALVAHLGGVHRWVAEVVRTRRRAAVPAAPAMGPERARAWFREGSDELLRVLADVPGRTPCWIIGERDGTAAFWRRRMVFENAKHLIDLRAAGGGRWSVAPEIGPKVYADGIDELFTEFLPRSRSTLPPLPGAVLLQATDVRRAWTITTDWTVSTQAAASPASGAVHAGAGDLALMLWERADPLRAGTRFDVRGDRTVTAALATAPIHPW